MESLVGTIAKSQGREVSVPLPGLRSWKESYWRKCKADSGSFSPVAGIKVVESQGFYGQSRIFEAVSVPLPGLRSWKDE